MSEKKTKLAKFDAFSKTDEDVRIRTRLGGIITLGCILTAIYLLGGEWAAFNEVTSVPRLVVDKDRSIDLNMNLDISFPFIPCDIINLDIMDDAGGLQLDILDSGFKKTRLDPNGKQLEFREFDLKDNSKRIVSEKGPNYCGSCYGAIDQSHNDEEGAKKVCCNTCEDVRLAYVTANWAFFDGKNIEQCEDEGYVKRINEHLNEGCRVTGKAKINRVKGNIHFAPGKPMQNSKGHLHDTSLYEKSPNMNFKHIIHHFSFGEPIDRKAKSKGADVLTNPLDDYDVQPNIDTHYHQFSYYMKVVPTRYEYLNRMVVETAQFSVTFHDRPLRGGKDEDHPNTIHARNGIPGVFFFFDISSIKVINNEQITQTWSGFILNCIITIGGVLAVGSMVDRLSYKAQKTYWGKKST
ncbi:hypothetical protein TPHA_0N00300 [Tetrapisispora phaffii CBS 4417]|uniref:Endoplasmic reticulum-Golgi intermediate compartment protein n=1 Tax=Tetrapisispora phaffii (strain ATCC 24235 / CBS 4417 / NBRC 1672 / NRRL Y-8282 / UCD 70-5) TaxID=1071381 RepID=G8C0Y3_TETPH|nr:hypothetical protein TPHA_0N00300 [Tetrapisispora phaffii CBS 4417]CCE65811.1 hypothetical protein TPHA_0N00300 [Tetrapisispora phaffii CBS 4417]